MADLLRLTATGLEPADKTAVENYVRSAVEANTIADHSITRIKLSQTTGAAILGATAAGDVTDMTSLAATFMPALTGDVTTAAGTVATTIAANVVSYAKLQQVAASSLVGNPTGALANAQGITLAGGLAFSGTTLTISGAIAPSSVTAGGAILSTTVAGGVGYSAVGTTVTQATSKSTSVAINRVCGVIKTSNAALAAAAIVTFTVTNTQVAATDTINLNLASGNTAGAYRYWIDAVAAGSFNISIENRSAGSLSQVLVFNFAVLKAS